MWFRSTRRGGIQDATGRHAQSVQYLLSRGVPGSARSISISIVEGTPRERDATQSGELRTLLCSSSGRCSALAVSEADAAGGRFADGGWHQYALSISPNGDVELFVDGSYRAGCARCNYISMSLSPDATDCSWYHSCDQIDNSTPALGHHTIDRDSARR